MIFLRMKYENLKRQREEERKGEEAAEDGDDWGSSRKRKQGRTRPTPRRPMRKAMPRGRR